MEEKRKNKRAPFNARISIESLYMPEQKETLNINASIIIVNISKSGIGFISESDLPVGYFFNTKISADDNRIFYCVLKIIRSKKINGGYNIGGEFIGLADILMEYIDDYVEKVNT